MTRFLLILLTVVSFFMSVGCCLSGVALIFNLLEIPSIFARWYGPSISVPAWFTLAFSGGHGICLLLKSWVKSAGHRKAARARLEDFYRR